MGDAPARLKPWLIGETLHKARMTIPQVGALAAGTRESANHGGGKGSQGQKRRGVTASRLHAAPRRD